MQSISDRFSHLTLGEPRAHQGLTVTPLIEQITGEADYWTLDEALERGELHVSELSEGGSVPELRLTNTSDRAVLLLDGEELVGAKQNRILNLSLLAPAGKTMIIPVSCVEAGRWSHVSREFSSGKRAYFASGRAKKAGHVTESLRSSGSRASEQSEIWRDIAEKSQRMESHSATAAMASLYEDQEANLSAFCQALPAQTNQVGAIFSVHGRVTGLELFDYPQTLTKLMPKLITSYALDAIDSAKPTAEEDAGDTMTPEDFIGAITAAEVTAHPSVGEGEDLRFTATTLSGGALMARERIIHLCAFRTPLEEQAGPRDRQQRMASATERRRRKL